MIHSPATMICRTTDLGDPGARSFVLTHAGDTIEGIVLHWAGRWYGYRNKCPHTGVNLNWLPDQFFDLLQHYLQCSMHGALFEPVTGYCVGGPCVGESLITLPLRVDEQRVYLDVVRLSIT